MKDAYDELICEKCNTYLQRVISNEELEEKYPVNNPPINIQDQENMKIWMDLKRLWKCEKCGEVTEISKGKLRSLAVKKKIGLTAKDKLLEKLRCAGCGDYWTPQFNNEELEKRYPLNNVPRRVQYRNRKKWIKLRRKMICPTCGDTVTISKKLLMKITKMSHGVK